MNNIREILMLLNCIVLGAITLFFFYKADKHDVVDEDYDENKRNRQGAIGWFIASIFVGALALPVMVLREVINGSGISCQTLSGMIFAATASLSSLALCCTCSCLL